MAIRFICPHCGHQIYVADDLDGRQGQCPKCGRFAMIQGQHIPDANVPNLVNIATAPENRPMPAGPAEKTIVMARGGSTMPAGAPRMMTAEPPRPAFPPPAAFPPPLPLPPPKAGSSRGTAALAAASVRARSSTSAAAVSQPEADAEDEGVGMQKLVLSIVAGAAAAAIIGILLFMIFVKKKDPTGTGTGTGAGTGGTGSGGQVADHVGPLYNLRLKGSVGIIINVPGTANEHLDHVQKELMTLADWIAEGKLQVPNYVVVYPTPPGDLRDAKSGTALTADDFKQWLDRPHGHSRGDVAAAAQYLVDQGPDAIVVITLNSLGDNLGRLEAVFKGKPGIAVFGIALGSEAAKADLERLVQGGGRYRYQTLSAR
jgi:hypothetical protein